VDYQGNGVALKVPEKLEEVRRQRSVTFAPDGESRKKRRLGVWNIVSVNQVQNDGSEQALENGDASIDTRIGRRQIRG